MNRRNTLVKQCIGVMGLALMFNSTTALASDGLTSEHKDAASRYVHEQAGNPYLPLWEHLPDGEPRVFEDPDKPGKFRAYIIGSHDVRFNSYCGPDIRMWSAPVEDLSSWRDEGPIFTYNTEDQWDVMYAPDLVEINRQDGKKEYYLYPHSRGRFREPMVCKSDRPDGPFTPVNMEEDRIHPKKGSFLGFDPSIFVEKITDKNDPDYSMGFRAYGFWGFQRSSAAQLDQNTMWSVRPGTEIIPYFIPASFRYGAVKEPAGTEYPALYKGQDPGQFNFFEASSIRQVGNKYVMVFSGHSGPDYGIGSSNSTLRYAYGDSPLGPWRSGGIVVDSRGIVPNEDGSALMTTNAGHNTHGSLQEINGQWYVFYHRPPRGFGFARQAVVAPVKIVADEKKVADGGKVYITGYDPYAKDNVWTAKDSKGNEYTGAEVTSEGFHIFGLDPYQYYSAGYACFMTNSQSMQDNWDTWDNSMDMKVKGGDIVGYKYFGFGGLDKDAKGIKAFKGTAQGNMTSFSIFLQPTTAKSFKVKVMMDGPWSNATWNGKQIGEIEVKAGSDADKAVKRYTVDVSKFVDNIDGKHAIYLVAQGDNDQLFVLKGIAFNNKKVEPKRPVAPKMNIKVDGKSVEIPAVPVRSTNKNGIVDNNTYEVKCDLTQGSKVTASADNKKVAITVKQATSSAPAMVIATYLGQTKVFNIIGNK